MPNSDFFLPDIEKTIQKKWEKQKFVFQNNKKPIFTLLMPPPNVTGSLHLGHALNNYLQDVLTRWHHIHGYQTLWIPGFDHAGIATEMLVKAWLKKHSKKIQKEDPIAFFYEWTEEKQTKIRQQWKQLGLMINTEKEEFTLSEVFQKGVQKALIHLFEEKLVYRAKKLVNWDPFLQTVISDIEVKHIAQKAKLYYFKYYFPDNPNQFIPVATSRPETMFADQAVMVNPKDKRYQQYIGKSVINPLTEKSLKILGISKVDSQFGSGAVKCTPGHDFFDFEIGKKYNLFNLNCFNKEGKLNKLSGDLAGLDRFEGRKKVLKILSNRNALIKEKSYHTMIPYSQRSNVIVEPYLTEQWFIKTQQWTKTILKKEKMIHFVPSKYHKTLIRWMENLNDWCISRQLKWGHSLPLYTNKKTGKIIASEKSPGTEWKQSSDVLDTWFSSGLWSLINFGWNNAQNKNLKNLLPINYLVTSYDIIFFWVARMLFLHYHFQKIIPFSKILIHGLVRTNNNEKMSKSKGNVIDPTQIINQYGSDALRFYLIGNHKIGEDFRFEEKKLIRASQFMHKLWNISLFMKKHQIYAKEEFNLTNIQNPINSWILQKWQNTKKNLEHSFQKHLFSLTTKQLTDFIYRNFSNQYLRIIWSYKQANKSLGELTDVTSYLWTECLVYLHSFAPFLTSYLYQIHTNRDILFHQMKTFTFNKPKSKLGDKFILLLNLIEKQKLKKGEIIKFHIQSPDMQNWKKEYEELNIILNPLGGKIEKISSAQEQKIQLDIIQNKVEKQKKKFTLSYYLKEIERGEKILNNRNFIEKANSKIIEKERKNLANLKKIVQNLTTKKK